MIMLLAFVGISIKGGKNEFKSLKAHSEMIQSACILRLRFKNY